MSQTDRALPEGRPGYSPRVFGYKMGNNGSRIRSLRLGALAIVLIGSVVFSRSGRAEEVLRFAYLALIVATMVVTTRRRTVMRRTNGPGYAAGRPSPFGVGDVIDAQARPTAVPPAPGTAGWLPDPSNPSAEHYWDGSSWTNHRRWNGSSWVEE